MRKIIKAVLSAALYILILVVIPNIGLQYLFQLVPAGSPPRMLIDKMNLQGIVMSISIVGVVLAILSFSANIVEDWSPIKLVSSIASAVVGFYLFLLFIGLGDPSRMGLTQLSIEVATIVWDFRFFIILELLLLGISTMRASVKFYFARKEHLVGR
jgi:hypothetical protein